MKKSPLYLGIIAALSTPIVTSVTYAAEGDESTDAERVEVTGSRIKRTDTEGQSPVFTLSRDDLDRSGVNSIGELLQQLTGGGKALNGKFNSSGNFGYPADGGGIGAGSVQVDLRHLSSKRVLVLVNGLRWVNESSASGVSGAVDLNTIPMAIVERIEVLEDGASAIYGSDAIAGVVNIITRKDYSGWEATVNAGRYGQGGNAKKAEFTWGSTSDGFNAVINVSFNKQDELSSNEYGISRTPKPFQPISNGGSSGTPQGRFRFYFPDDGGGRCGAFVDDDGNPVNPDGSVPFVCNLTTDYRTDFGSDDIPTFPGQYIQFSGDTRFNFAPYNLILTPSERKSIFAGLNGNINSDTSWFARFLINQRESTNQAAPEPIFVGPDAGAGTVLNSVEIPADQPFNPFGIDLVGPQYDVGGNLLNLGTFSFFTRRPLEGGPRIFDQSVDTTYFTAGLEGAMSNGYEWNVNFITAKNEAEQDFRNGYNTKRIRNALGSETAPGSGMCTDGSLPAGPCLNIFGGMGTDQAGTITPAMLQYITADTHDESDQNLMVISANITGDLIDMANGPLSFAAGFEHRNYKGEYRPSALRVPDENNESESVDSSATAFDGDYDVNELYAELNVPLSGNFEIMPAIRFSDYSNFGQVTTGKLGFRWRLSDEVLLRGTYAQGFRAPVIGELFGTAFFGPEVADPCSNYGDLAPSDPTYVTCEGLGIPNNYEQLNPQITQVTGGNDTLDPEESTSNTLGAVFSPEWMRGDADRVDFEFTYYKHEIDDVILGPSAQAILDECFNDGDAGSAVCQNINRTAAGFISSVDGKLENSGTLETSGYDFKVTVADDSGAGKIKAAMQVTRVISYKGDGDLARGIPGPVGGVGIEAEDGAIPEIQANTQIDYGVNDWSLGWTMRYISGVTETVEGVDYRLKSMTYHDAQFNLDNAFTIQGLRFTVGINNVFKKDPPICLSCSLNGYDAGTYDLPDRFVYVTATYRSN